MKKIAIIGTNGVPSKYGGFETLVENLVDRLSYKFELSIVCSSLTNDRNLKTYKNSKLLYVPLKANGWQSIPFDIISILITIRNNDKVLVLGASGCLILPFLFMYRHKLIFLFGGLDWKRSKWNFFAKKILKISESLGINFSNTLISDNVGIQKYTKNTYGKDSHLIEYGGDQAFIVKPDHNHYNKYPFLTNDYALCVARIQKDNNLEMILESFNKKNKLPVVIIGNWKFSSYGFELKNKYKNVSNIILLDAIYEPVTLNVLRSNCKVYIHGHSCGGTNPALVEAMFLKIPVFAHGNIFNRETTNNSAIYFNDSKELSHLLETTTNDELTTVSNNLFKYATKNYKWEKIINKYEKIFKI